MKIIGGFQDTRSNAEDFALTSYLFLVVNKGVAIKVYGLGLCWGYYAAFLGFGINLPKGFPAFISFTKDKKMKQEIIIK